MFKHSKTTELIEDFIGCAALMITLVGGLFLTSLF